MKIHRIVVLVLTSAMLVFSSATAPAAEGPRGEAFTDPSYRFPMPEEWTKRPVLHDKEAGKADLAVILDQGSYPLLLPFIQKYAGEQGLNISVMEGTCGISAGALARKSADIGGFCCPPGKEDRLPGLKFHTLGIVGIAFIVSPDNPLDSVTGKQLEDIFRGKIYRWSELKAPDGKAGPDLKIRTIGRFHCQARPGHWRLLLKDNEQFSPKLYEVGSIPDMIAGVARHKDAIGWEVLGMTEKYENLGKVKPLRIDGYPPVDVGALAAGQYPFYRTYNITTWEGAGVENPHAQGLVDYLMKEADRIDPKYGFVPASRLRGAGWKFSGNELIGEPG